MFSYPGAYLKNQLHSPLCLIFEVHAKTKILRIRDIYF